MIRRRRFVSGKTRGLERAPGRWLFRRDTGARPVTGPRARSVLGPGRPRFLVPERRARTVVVRGRRRRRERRGRGLQRQRQRHGRRAGRGPGRRADQRRVSVVRHRPVPVRPGPVAPALQQPATERKVRR